MLHDWMKKSAVIGVVGFPSLPGSIGYAGATFEQLAERAVADAKAYAAAGFDALMIQNVGDLPVPERVGPETVAWLAALGRAVRDAVSIPLGVCILKSDGPSSLAVCQAIGGDFVRVKVWVGAMVGAEGIVQGSALETLQYRKHIGAEQIAVWADVHDRTGVPLAGMTLEETAHEAVWFGKADGLVITGRSVPETLEWVGRVKRSVRDVPVWIGGSATAGNVGDMLSVADGVVVATSVKAGGQLLNPVDPAAARQLVEAARYRGR